MIEETLESSIRNKLALGNATPSGYYEVKCPVCKDYKVRAGFRFLEDGTIIYHCFRGKCSASTVWKPHEPLHAGIRRVMKAFEIEIPSCILQESMQAIKTRIVNQELYKEHQFSSFVIPPDLIEPYNPSRHDAYRKFLDSRGMQDKDYYVGYGKLANCLVIPLRWKNSLMGYESVRVFGGKVGRYGYSHGNTNLMYVETGWIPENPIIVEGVFDAKSVPNGIAVFGNDISKEQAYHLQDKNPILFPDKDSSKFVAAALKYGWRMTLPKEMPGKDANEAMIKLGRLELASRIHESIVDPSESLILKYKLWSMN